MTIFEHFYGFINNIFPKTVLKFQHFSKNPHKIQVLRGTRAACLISLSQSNLMSTIVTFDFDPYNLEAVIFSFMANFLKL